MPGDRLLADIGGTNVRFAMQVGDGPPTHVRRLPVAHFASLDDAMTAYLDGLYPPRSPTHAALAVAAPVSGDRVTLTNSPWRFSQAGLRRRFGLASLSVINDFTAIALGVPHLPGSGRRKVGRGRAVRGETIGVLGPGTGLGISGLVPCGGRYVPLASEGGKVTLAPFDRFEAEVIAVVWRERAHVSAERLLSGSGIELLHRAIAAVDGRRAPTLSAATITARATKGTCPHCRRTVKTFSALLGTVAADLALTLGARGGIYIAGGIVPRFGVLFGRVFRRRFETKGRFSAYLSLIPTYVVTYGEPALLGLAALPAADAR